LRWFEVEVVACLVLFGEGSHMGPIQKLGKVLKHPTSEKNMLLKIGFIFPRDEIVVLKKVETTIYKEPYKRLELCKLLMD